ncbi:hypothetical protein [Microbacterium schleiferi]|uniref:hypothetical protein n=1 Tax=Microbacterium schleiferi TaxID=69362 RepID=UPI001D17661B|nr:hypothetical protein [Microbacterium schleiferi]MCC4267431.1 hypothetical protein [Microbacterium schleiferi]
MLHSELNEPRAPIIERLRALNAIVDQVGTPMRSVMNSRLSVTLSPSRTRSDGAPRREVLS